MKIEHMCSSSSSVAERLIASLVSLVLGPQGVSQGKLSAGYFMCDGMFRWRLLWRLSWETVTVTQEEFCYIQVNEDTGCVRTRSLPACTVWVSQGGNNEQGANWPPGKPPSCIDPILEKSGYCQEAAFDLEGEISFHGIFGRGRYWLGCS